MSDIDDSDDTISDDYEQRDEGKLRTCTGLLKSYHGVAYQIQWLMVVAIEAKKRGKVDGFTFRTEVDYEDSGKFDDVVWKYYCDNDKRFKYNFLQAKHKLNEETDRITMKDLKKEKSPFGLKKYYVSFKESIQNNNKYTSGVVENLIIATNIDLEDSLKQIFVNSQAHTPLLNDFGTEKCRLPKCWKIDPNNENMSSVVAFLEETHDLIKLAKMLEDLIFNDKKFTIPIELHKYSCSIFKNLLSINCDKISDDFIENKNLSNQGMFLREAFLYIAFEKKRHVLYDTEGVINVFRETSVYDIEDFASFIASKINDTRYENKLVKIRLTKKCKNYENYKYYISRLANFVLIRKDGIQFNRKFWIQEEIEGSNFFEILKIKLKCKLIHYGLISHEDTNEEIFAKLDPYKFQITNFTTCMMHLVDENTFWKVVKDYNTGLSTVESQSSIMEETLPNYNLRQVREDLRHFFSILVFAVNYTKKILNEVVEDNFNENFKWIDNEFTAYAFRSEIANTLDLTQEKIISNTAEVTQFFNKVEKECNRLILIGPTLEYCTKIELYDIKFKSDVTNIPGLNCFIDNNAQQLKTEQTKNAVDMDKQKDFYNKQVLCYTSKYILLSSIKVYHLLKNSVNYAAQKNYIFMRLESIVYLYEYVMNVFEKSVSLLIIECDCDESKINLRKVCKKLISIMHSDANKKVLLITPGDNYLTNQLRKELLRSYCQIVDSEVINYSSLEEKTQEKFLRNWKIIFQGKEIFFEDVIADGKELIDSKILCQFLNNDKIEICNQSLTKNSVKNFYISRQIICRRKVSAKVFKEESTDLYAFRNIEINEFMNLAMQYEKNCTNIVSKVRNFGKLDLKNLSNIKFIVVDDDDQYKYLWESNKSSNVHKLIKENDYFKWNDTKGSLCNLRPYTRPRKYYSEYDNEIIYELKNDRIVVISADPGMGKSTLIRNLAFKLKHDFPLFWVLVIDLGNFRSDLKRIKLNDEESAFSFLVKVVNFKFLSQKRNEIWLSKIIDWLNKRVNTNDFMNEVKIEGIDLMEIFLFYNKLHSSGEVYIFLDGFDEVCPKYEAETTYFIKVVKRQTKANIWVTCRTYNIINTLEDNLETISYGIKSFSKDDQEIFLLKYWKFKLNIDILDEQRAKIFIVTLLLEFSKATNDTKRTFVGIPLQIQMLAQNRLIMFKEFYESGVATLNDEDKINIKRGLNLVNLYDEFIDIKFYEIRFKEKKPKWPVDDEDIERMIEKCREDFIYEHQVLSIYTLYPEKEELCSESIKSQALSLLPKIMKAHDKNAIISEVIVENPVFVHQTYAEYFASLFLWNKFKSVSLEEFHEFFLHNMLNGTFFSDEQLQVCKFFYFMADKYFNENIQCIYNGNEDCKIALILENISDIIYVIYDSYANQGIKCQGIDDIVITDYSGNAKNIERVFKQNPQFAQVVKFMFYMVESYLTVNPSDRVIHRIVEKNNCIHFLQMASEIGCSNFVKTFLSVKGDYDFKKSLMYSKWYFSPVWLAARNGQFDILKQLSLVVDPKWLDKDDQTLAQRAYELPEFEVLRSCLLLNILDANPYSNLNKKQTLPLENAFANTWPLKIIEILIEKTDSDIFNNFVCSYGPLKASHAISISLLKYETPLLTLMIKKGMNFFGALNVLLFEFILTSLHNPINSVRYASYYGPSFHSEQEYLRVYGLIETYLHSGFGYNSFDDVHCVTTSEYSKQIHYMHQLFVCIRNNEMNNIDSAYLLLTHILCAVAKECTIVKSSDSSLLLRIQQLKSITSQKKRKYNALEGKVWPKCYYHGIIINLIPITENNFFDCLDKPKDFTKNCISAVSVYMKKASKEIKEFKKYPDSNLYNNIFIAYEEMLKYRLVHDASKNKLFQSLPRFEKYIFQWVLNLYIRQNYDIFEALNEVSRNIVRFKMIRDWLRKKPDGCNISFEEIIQIFGLEQGQGNNKDVIVQNEITEIISNIFNSGALQLLLNVWNDLNHVGEELFQEVVTSMSKYEHISTKIFYLFEKLDEYYVRLIEAIKSENPQNLLQSLKNIDDAYVKSVVNAQDCEYGSPLHYAVFVGNAEMVRMLLSHGADPNQELECNNKLLADSEEYSIKTPLDIALDRKHRNPQEYVKIIEVLNDSRIKE